MMEKDGMNPPMPLEMSLLDGEALEVSKSWGNVGAEP
jgi:hypothetical protein